MAVVMVLGAVVWAARARSPRAAGSGLASVSGPNSLRYLPLGDSYTIGQSVAEADRWPNQLTAQYKPAGKALAIVANPARTGFTTQDLIDQELTLIEQLRPDFVTVQIGVNDYVQGSDAATFEKRLRYIVTYLRQKLTRPQNLLLVTIPDYAKTPAGAHYGDPARATAAITQYNTIIKAVAKDNNLPVADVFVVSQGVDADPRLTASDGLHPSAKQYAAWTTVIRQVLEAARVPE